MVQTVTPLSPYNTAALCHRSLGFEGLDDLEKAYLDIKEANNIDREDKALQKLLERIEDRLVS